MSVQTEKALQRASSGRRVRAILLAGFTVGMAGGSLEATAAAGSSDGVSSTSTSREGASRLEGAAVVDAPAGFSYEVFEVTFREPRRMSVGAGVRLEHRAIKVVVRGEGLRAAATGPVLYLNGVAINRTTVSDDHRTATGYAYGVGIDAFQVTVKGGRWELILQSNVGAPEVYRVPSAKPTSRASGRPSVTRLLE